MKLIADSPITSGFITEWARPSNAVIASHYFWIAGTTMQKSQQGLLQTLLYDIFRQCPYLIEQICAERWASSQPAGSWSLAELRGALHAVATKDNVGLKFCFIIDGLDEYSGDHEDRFQLCRTFKDLAESGNIKLCLSSRPWTIFEEEFGVGFPKLYMQDLTRDDIHDYVTSRLEEHTRWAIVSADHSQGQWLVSEIAAKSNGVFLWVFLVTKLLREGLTNRDRFSDLRRRLESFPSELEPFFKAILESVEPFYHSHMSTALQIAIASTESQLTFLSYSFHFQEYEDNDYAANIPIRTMNKNEIQEIKNNTLWHLDSRTRGLLEVDPIDGTVTLLHRTARDFLKTQEMHDFLIAKSDDSLRFRPILSVLKAHVAMIKTSSVPNEIIRETFGKFKTGSNIGSQYVMLKLLSEALKYAKELELHIDKDSRHHVLLDELDRAIQCLLSRRKCKLAPSSISNLKKAVFREQLVTSGLFDYLHRKLDREPDFLVNVGQLTVFRFLSIDPTIQGFRLQRGRGTDVLASLLETRCIDPNREENDYSISPWEDLLQQIHYWWTSLGRKNATHVLSFLLEEKIFMLFLKAGADPNAKIWASTSSVMDRQRAAAVVYLEFCFNILSESQQTQLLFLDVLNELLRLSNDSTLKDVCEEFCTLLGDKPEANQRGLNLPFLSRVLNVLLLSLGAHGPETAETRQALDKMATQIFPLDLYTPLEMATPASSRGKRKQEAESSNSRRKSRRRK